ncbi:MAG: hypothetical protein C0459_02330 [Chitinophaga sp.]|jgi:hypothetical protein|nr:hypothetical protein [Chitinophaga sp.]
MKCLLTVLLSFTLLQGFSQEKLNDSVPAKNLSDSVAARRNELNKNNLYFLTGWAAVNIVQGGISATNAKGSNKYFFQMNTYWNVVNLAVAGVGLYTIKKEMNKKLTAAENYKKQNNLEKFLLFNTGLDATYLTTGLYLNERGKRLNNETTEGYGSSLILQGGFLLVFDIIQYLEHRQNGKKLNSLIDKISLGSTPNGAGLVYNF